MIPRIKSVVRPLISRYGKTAVVLFMVLLYAGYFSWSSFIQAGVGDASADDLGHAWQTVWNVGHGHGFNYTHIPTQENISRLATHTDYFLVLLAPLAWLWPNYQVLLLFQAVIVAAGIWLVWLIAKRLIPSQGLALAITVAYALYGPLQFATVYQFHAVTLAVTFILGMVEAIVARRSAAWVWLWFGLAIICKEQVGIIAGAMAILVGWPRGRKKLGGLMFLFGSLFSAIQFLWIIPAFRPVGDAHFLWHFYYGSLGTTPGEIIPRLLQPAEWWHRLITPIHGRNVLALLLPLGGLSLLSPMTLLGGVALIPHWMADEKSVNTLFYQNHVLAIPAIMIGTIYGAVRVTRWSGWKRIKIMIPGAVIFLAIIGSVALSPNPWSLNTFTVWWQRDKNIPALAKANRQIPEDVIVAYSWCLPPIFRNRERVLVLPYGKSQADYVVVAKCQNDLLMKWSGTYYLDLLKYFDRSAAFKTIIRTEDYGIYHRNKEIEPELWPTGMPDPTPRATQGYSPRVL